MNHSVLSKELTDKIPKIVKKNNGIYFTPISCVNHTLKLLEPHLHSLLSTSKGNVVNVLEPSCGSGEYITALNRAYPAFHITGIEWNETIYEHILQLGNEHIAIQHADFLQFQPKTKYELILGNPPYYVMKKEEVDKKYYSYFEGRPNIFILFIIKSLEMLSDNGILSFILPKNFLNCLYYDKTRQYINQYFEILHIVDCKDDKYIETQQDTILLIIQKPLPKPQPTKPQRKLQPTPQSNERFILQIHNYTVFTEEGKKGVLMNLYRNSKSLWDLGFKVSVGTVVWNQCKNILTHDQTKTRLIYSSDIVDNQLIMKKYNNEEKKNFINKAGITRPMIVINRGYGVGEYQFHYCLIDEQKEYLIENHLICIESRTDLSRDVLVAEYKKIIESLHDPRTTEFINLYFGNNAINTTELNYILPVYQDI
jgi:adenine-specific DNA-methyltransferase